MVNPISKNYDKKFFEKMRKSLQEILDDKKRGIETEDKFGEFVNNVEASINH